MSRPSIRQAGHENTAKVTTAERTMPGRGDKDRFAAKRRKGASHLILRAESYSTSFTEHPGFAGCSDAPSNPRFRLAAGAAAAFFSAALAR